MRDTIAWPFLSGWRREAWSAFLRERGDLLAAMAPASRAAVVRNYGLDGQPAENFRQQAERLGVTTTTVRTRAMKGMQPIIERYAVTVRAKQWGTPVPFEEGHAAVTEGETDFARC